MRSVLRSVLAVLAGFVVATAVMMTVESINGRVLYPELGRATQGIADREAIRGLLASAPVGALLVVLLGWVLGSAAGGWVSARLAGRARVAHALVTGALLTLAGVANNLMIPPPLWFWIAGLVVFVPPAWLAARLLSDLPRPAAQVP
jgi:hypothetical protein